MKIAGVLLSLLIVFLSTVPCCWDTCEEDGTTSHVEKTSGMSEVCSPFLSCGSCAGFVLQEDFTEFSSFNGPIDCANDQQQASFKADYSFKIWQPPEEVT